MKSIKKLLSKYGELQRIPPCKLAAVLEENYSNTIKGIKIGYIPSKEKVKTICYDELVARLWFLQNSGSTRIASLSIREDGASFYQLFFDKEAFPSFIATDWTRPENFIKTINDVKPFFEGKEWAIEKSGIYRLHLKEDKSSQFLLEKNKKLLEELSLVRI